MSYNPFQVQAFFFLFLSLELIYWGQMKGFLVHKSLHDFSFFPFGIATKPPPFYISQASILAPLQSHARDVGGGEGREEKVSGRK